MDTREESIVSVSKPFEPQHNSRVLWQENFTEVWWRELPLAETPTMRPWNNRKFAFGSTCQINRSEFGWIETCSTRIDSLRKTFWSSATTIRNLATFRFSSRTRFTAQMNRRSLTSSHLVLSWRKLIDFQNHCTNIHWSFLLESFSSWPSLLHHQLWLSNVPKVCSIVHGSLAWHDVRSNSACSSLH